MANKRGLIAYPSSVHNPRINPFANFFNSPTQIYMSIQWFPGHMNTARREAAKTMETIDVIVEVLDARMPGSQQ